MTHVSMSWTLLRRLAVLAVAGGMLLAASTPTFAQGNSGKGGGKGGGGGGGSEPPPAPVQYGLIIFAMPGGYAGGTATPQEMNDAGEIVGYYNLPDGTAQPYYYDVHSRAAAATNLNDFALDPNHDVPAGWYLYAATGINNWGDISGALVLSSDPSILRGFVLELRPDPLDSSVLPRLHLLPDQEWDRTYARRINDVGEVLGRGDAVTSYVYRPGLHGLEADTEVEILPFPFDAWSAHMNNPTNDHGTQIIARSGDAFVHYTLGDSQPQTINLAISDVRGLSDSGSFCGVKKGKGNKSHGYLYDGTLHDLTSVEFAQDVNAHDDVLGSPGLVLFHSTHGELDVRALTIAESDAEQELWENSTPRFAKLTERGIDGTPDSVSEFPTIFGSLRRFDTPYSFYYDLFVLVPLEVEAP